MLRSLFAQASSRLVAQNGCPKWFLIVLPPLSSVMLEGDFRCIFVDSPCHGCAVCSNPAGRHDALFQAECSTSNRSVSSARPNHAAAGVSSVSCPLSFSVRSPGLKAAFGTLTREHLAPILGKTLADLAGASQYSLEKETCGPSEMRRHHAVPVSRSLCHTHLLHLFLSPSQRACQYTSQN
jgi:hypothetical protein